MGPQEAVRRLDGLIIFYGKFYIPIPSFALAIYSCVGFPTLNYGVEIMWDCIFHLIFSFSERFFSKVISIVLAFSLIYPFFASALLYAIGFPRLLLALYSGSIALPVSTACLLFISESSLCFLQCFVPTCLVIPLYWQLLFFMFLFTSGSILCLWFSQSETTCLFFDPCVFLGSVLTYLCVGSHVMSLILLPKGFFTSYHSPGSQL